MGFAPHCTYMPDTLKHQQFTNNLLNWHSQHGRNHLPWQKNISPYRVWLSEIMLQQTQVTTVIPYFQRFTQRFNNVHALAAAPIDEILHLWTGLGYYARARNLHKCAQIISQKYHGIFPPSINELNALPGIGRSTAGAIASISMHIRAPILDGNVKRVLTRYFAIAGAPNLKQVENQLWRLSEQLLPTDNLPIYTQAIMDLGATICTRSKPNCTICPQEQSCIAHAQGTPEAYPTPKPKKHKPNKQTYMLLLQANGQLLLEKRPDKGIWGGLWSLPEIPKTDELPNFNAENTQLLPTFKHSFTHYHLHISPLLINLKQQAVPEFLQLAEKQYDWYYPQTNNLIGLPQPVAKLLRTHFS